MNNFDWLAGELFAAFVLSTQAHARLVKVDPSPGLMMKGVIDFITYLDVPGRNFWGAGGEEVFASTEVKESKKILYSQYNIAVQFVFSLNKLFYIAYTILLYNMIVQCSFNSE